MYVCEVEAWRGRPKPCSQLHLGLETSGFTSYGKYLPVPFTVPGCEREGRRNPLHHKPLVNCSGANKVWAYTEDGKLCHNQHVHKYRTAPSRGQLLWSLLFNHSTNFRSLPLHRKKWKCFSPSDEFYLVSMPFLKNWEISN